MSTIEDLLRKLDSEEARRFGLSGESIVPEEGSPARAIFDLSGKYLKEKGVLPEQGYGVLVADLDFMETIKVSIGESTHDAQLVDFVLRKAFNFFVTTNFDIDPNVGKSEE